MENSKFQGGYWMSLQGQNYCKLDRSCQRLFARTIGRRRMLIVLLMLVFATTLLGLTTTAYATNSDAVSIAVERSVKLSRVKSLYKATTNITVSTRQPRGFNLTMQAGSSADLVNERVSSYRIKSLPLKNHSEYLASNQWGYNTYSSAIDFYGVPSHNQTASSLASASEANKDGCTDISNCTKTVMFAANIDPSKLVSGNYSTTIIYTATAKLPAEQPTPLPGKKYTTNGCYKSINDTTGDNCSVTSDKYITESSFITWRGDKWTKAGSNKFNYGNGEWLISSGMRSAWNDLWSGTESEAVTYVPRFAEEGNYIRFCKDITSYGCRDREVKPAFAGGKLGVWVPLRNLNCQKHVKMTTENYDQSYNAIAAATTLIKAFGSPCPK